MSKILPSIEKIIQAVFPSGCQIISAKEVAPEERYWVIPGKSGYPRWIIPQSVKFGMPGLNFWWPYDFSSRLKWKTVLTAYQSGFLNALPGISSFGAVSGSKNNWSHLGWNQEAPPAPVVYMGDPIERGKAISFLVDTEKRHCTYVAKAPIGKSAASKILHEANILQMLEEEKTRLGPSILYKNEQMGIAGQQALPVELMPKVLSQEHIIWLSKLRLDSTTSLEAMTYQLEQRLLSTSEGLGKIKEGPLQWLLDSIKDPTPLPSVWVHGDFAPWNFKRLPTGSLIAIDWEESVQGGLPFYDLLHYHFIQQDLKSRNEAILRTLYENPLVTKYMKNFGLSQVLTKKIYFYFILDYWCRRLEDTDDQLAQIFYEASIRHVLK